MSIKNYVLAELKMNEFVSGQALAEKFGVSRAAIWKAVSNLKNDGFIIESVNNRGYKLISNADTISEYEIKRTLDKNASDLKIVILKSVDSTNNEAKRILAKGITENYLIIANEQTGGRGRLGRNFYSPKDTGIYMSFLMQSSLPLSDAVTVTTAVSVAVVKAIKKVMGIDAVIKWVNDVYIDNKKICGILTEAVSDFETGTATAVIIGIGINTSTQNFPDDVKDKATSLNAKEPVRNQLIATVANELYYLYKRLPDRSCFINDYKNYSMVLGKPIVFYMNNISYNGIAEDIDENGGLIVSLNDGSKTTLSSGEVTLRLA